MSSGGLVTVSPVRFTSAQLIGGSSVVVPGGTVLRCPAIGTFDFSGMDTLSMAVTVAGLAGGDSFKVYCDTANPLHVANDPIPANLGRRLLITAAADGDYAGMLNLRTTLSTPGTQVLRVSAAATNSIAWGHPGSANFVDGYNNAGKFNRFTRGLGVGGLLTADLNFNSLTDPGVDTGFVLFITMRTDMNDTSSGFEIHADQPGHVNLVDYFWWNPGYTGFMPPLGGKITASFVEYAMPFTVPDATLIDFTKIMSVTVDYGGLAFNGATSNWDVTDLRFECPGAAGGGGTSQAIPFFKNLIYLDNSGSAHDVTVSHLLAELTRSRRRHVLSGLGVIR